MAPYIHLKSDVNGHPAKTQRSRGGGGRDGLEKCGWRPARDLGNRSGLTVGQDLHKCYQSISKQKMTENKNQIFFKYITCLSWVANSYSLMHSQTHCFHPNLGDILCLFFAHWFPAEHLHITRCPAHDLGWRPKSLPRVIDGFHEKAVEKGKLAINRLSIALQQNC